MDLEIIKKEAKIKHIRSSGSGGQHVNKVSTKVELIIDIGNSAGLTQLEKDRIGRKLKNKINKEGHLIIADQSSRSQLLNRRSAFKKLERLLKKALELRSVRRGSTTPKANKEKRLKSKKVQSEKKRLRGKVNLPL